MNDIEKVIDWLKGERDNYDGRDHAYHYLDLALFALEAQQADRWIPITERLPKIEEFYIITIIKWDGKHSIEYCYFKDGKWLMIADGTHEENTSWEEEVKSVIAWKPLPKPWKEEAFENEGNT